MYLVLDREVLLSLLCWWGEGDKAQRGFPTHPGEQRKSVENCDLNQVAGLIGPASKLPVSFMSLNVLPP